MKELRGKVALVTGASSGIGEAIALQLAQAGAQVIVTGRDGQRLAQVVARCGAQSWAHAAEVSDEASMQQLADAVHAKHDALNILVNNAGVTMAGLAWEVEASDWRRLHEINVMGVVHGIRAFVPRMVARKRGGHIVNMASVAGYAGARGMGTYAASKFAVVGLSESLRAELYRHRIGVSVICPGYVKTPIREKVKVVGVMAQPRSLAAIERAFDRATLTPEIVAARTLRAIVRGQDFVTLGREAAITHALKRMAPGLLARLVRG